MQVLPQEPQWEDNRIKNPRSILIGRQTEKKIEASVEELEPID